MSYPYLARTILKYKSPHATDLSFVKDEVIRVTGPHDDEDWLVGESKDGTRSGGFPKDFVVPTDDEDDTAAVTGAVAQPDQTAASASADADLADVTPAPAPIDIERQAVQDTASTSSAAETPVVTAAASEIPKDPEPRAPVPPSPSEPKTAAEPASPTKPETTPTPISPPSKATPAPAPISPVKTSPTAAPAQPKQSEAPASAPPADDVDPSKMTMKERLAFFAAAQNKASGPPPPIKPKPASSGLTWSQRQKLRQEQEAKEREAEAAARAERGGSEPKEAVKESAEPAPEHTAAAEAPPTEPKVNRDKVGTGMSASDAASSIQKGGSLKERMAALQAGGAFGRGAEPEAPKVASTGKVWTRPPAPPAPEPIEGEEGEEGAPPPPMDIPRASETGEEEGGEAEEADDEDEKARRAAIAARMAKLGARGPMGMAMPMPGMGAPARRAPAPETSEPATDSVDDDNSRQAESEGPAEAAQAGHLEAKTSGDESAAPVASSAPPASVKMPAVPRRTAGPRRRAPASSNAASPVESRSETPAAAETNPTHSDEHSTQQVQKEPIGLERVDAEGNILPPPQVPSEEIPLQPTHEERQMTAMEEDLGRGPHGAEGAESAGISLSPPESAEPHSTEVRGHDRDMAAAAAAVAVGGGLGAAAAVHGPDDDARIGQAPSQVEEPKLHEAVGSGPEGAEGAASAGIALSPLDGGAAADPEIHEAMGSGPAGLEGAAAAGIALSPVNGKDNAEQPLPATSVERPQTPPGQISTTAASPVRSIPPIPSNIGDSPVRSVPSVPEALPTSPMRSAPPLPGASPPSPERAMPPPPPGFQTYSQQDEATAPAVTSPRSPTRAMPPVPGAYDASPRGVPPPPAAVSLPPRAPASDDEDVEDGEEWEDAPPVPHRDTTSLPPQTAGSLATASATPPPIARSIPPRPVSDDEGSEYEDDEVDLMKQAQSGNLDVQVHDRDDTDGADTNEAPDLPPSRPSPSQPDTVGTGAVGAIGAVAAGVGALGAAAVAAVTGRDNAPPAGETLAPPAHIGHEGGHSTDDSNSFKRRSMERPAGPRASPSGPRPLPSRGPQPPTPDVEDLESHQHLPPPPEGHPSIPPRNIQQEEREASGRGDEFPPELQRSRPEVSVPGTDEVSGSPTAAGPRQPVESEEAAPPPNVNPRSAIAARMAALGGVKFGAPPPVRKRSMAPEATEPGATSPQRETAEEPQQLGSAADSTQLQESTEDEETPEQEAARRRATLARLRAGGALGFGVFTPHAPEPEPETTEQSGDRDDLGDQRNVSDDDAPPPPPPRGHTMDTSAPPPPPRPHTETDAPTPPPRANLDEVAPPPPPRPQGAVGAPPPPPRPQNDESIAPPLPPPRAVPPPPPPNYGDAPPPLHPASEVSRSPPRPPVPQMSPPIPSAMALHSEDQAAPPPPPRAAPPAPTQDDDDEYDAPPPPPPRAAPPPAQQMHQGSDGFSAVPQRSAPPPPQEERAPPVPARQPSLPPPPSHPVAHEQRSGEPGGAPALPSGRPGVVQSPPSPAQGARSPPPQLAQIGRIGSHRSQGSGHRGSMERGSMSVHRPGYNELQAASASHGSALLRAARQMFDQGKRGNYGDGSSPGFVHAAFEQAGIPFPAGEWGLAVYEQEASSVLKKLDDPRPGDIVAIHDGKFKGKKGLSSYHQQVGSIQDPLIAIIHEFDVRNKHKLRVLQVERGVPSEVSYRLDDLKSGRVFVYRVGIQ